MPPPSGGGSNAPPPWHIAMPSGGGVHSIIFAPPRWYIISPPLTQPRCQRRRWFPQGGAGNRACRSAEATVGRSGDCASLTGFLGGVLFSPSRTIGQISARVLAEPRNAEKTRQSQDWVFFVRQVLRVGVNDRSNLCPGYLSNWATVEPPEFNPIGMAPGRPDKDSLEL